MLSLKKISSLMLVVVLLPLTSYAADEKMEDYFPKFMIEQCQMQKDIPIRLKIDKYYILYTNPYGPYIDKDGNMIVSLKMVEDVYGNLEIQ